jgi:hypothetical protein
VIRNEISGLCPRDFHSTAMTAVSIPDLVDCGSLRGGECLGGAPSRYRLCRKPSGAQEVCGIVRSARPSFECLSRDSGSNDTADPINRASSQPTKAAPEGAYGRLRCSLAGVVMASDHGLCRIGGQANRGTPHD